MYETFYREKGLVEVEAVPRQPYVKKERQVYPGVRSLTLIDPMTGKDAKDGSELIVTVHNISSVAITLKHKKASPVLLVQYICTTPEGARIDAANFINTETPDRKTLNFFDNRALAVRLPCEAKSLSWQLKGARKPVAVTVRKKGRYWNVVEEHWA